MKRDCNQDDDIIPVSSPEGSCIVARMFNRMAKIMEGIDQSNLVMYSSSKTKTTND